MRILIIEDERRLLATLADLLEEAGYHTDRAEDGESGLRLARTGIYDGVILDVMLPGINGYQVVSRLRKEGISTPVLMLTARSELTDRVRGLDAGADYYLTKPFENEEFLACLRSILRRQNDFTPDCLTFADLTLEPSLSELRCGAASVSLSARELELLELLMQNSSQYLSKELLLMKVWGYDAPVNENSVEAYISFLRKKLLLLHSSAHINVVRKIGYRLEVQDK